jgi:hypothetical protein
VHLEQLAALDEVANRHRLDAERLGLAATACPVLIALKLDKLGQASDQSSDFLSLIVGQRLFEMAMAFGGSPYT